MNAPHNCAGKLSAGTALFGLLLAMVMANGCASTSDAGAGKAGSTVVADLAMPSPGKSKVVFLRPGVFAYAVHFGIHDGEQLVGKSSSSSYFAYECDPGHHVFSASMDNVAFLDADLLPDRIYYVRVKAVFGTWVSGVKMFALYPGCAEFEWQKIPKTLASMEKETINNEDVRRDAVKATEYMKRLKEAQDKAKPGDANKIRPDYGQATPLSFAVRTLNGRINRA
jgi:hypothetical protein